MSGPSRRPLVSVLSLGGTIAMAAGGPRGVSPSLGGDDLVASVPGLGELAEVRARSLSQLPGAHLDLSDVVALAGEVGRAIDDGSAGVVVTQGTDTLEETAFLLDLLVRMRQPVVVTGAMRNPTLAGADGPANLLAAVAVATAATTRDLGVLVVLNDEIHAARFVQKRHTTSPGAFRSFPGPLGWLCEGRPRVVVRPEGRPPARRVLLGASQRVGLLTVT
ncbi:MAG: asparaginase domain-containing protein, partial [Acidimicrobiales bacterium]